jgi:hypothetical protein
MIKVVIFKGYIAEVEKDMQGFFSGKEVEILSTTQSTLDDGEIAVTVVYKKVL